MDSRSEAPVVAGPERCTQAIGAKASAKKGLVGIDIADSGYNLLVEEGRLDRPFRPPHCGRKVLAGDAEGVGAEECPTGLELGRAPERPEASEAPRIPKDQHLTTLDLPRCVDMVGWRLLAIGDQPKLPRHAKMHDQSAPTFGNDRELLAAALEGLNHTTLKQSNRSAYSAPGCNADVRPVQDNLVNAAARERLGQAAADGFDFGKFRHVRLNAGRPWVMAGEGGFERDQ